MKNLKKLLALSTVCAMAMTTLAGCGGDADDDTVIKWGVNYEKTGTAATYGTSHVEGIELAIEEINKAGGVNVDGAKKQIKAEVLDNKTSDTDMPTVYNQLVEDGNVVILGPAITNLTIQAFQMADENKVPTLTASATGDDVTKTSDGGIHPYGFKICYSDSYQGKALAIAANDKGYKKILIYSDNSNDYAVGLAKVFTNEFTKLGGKIVATKSYTKGDKDFNSVLTSIKGMDYDAILVPGYYEEASQIIKQAREMGIEKPILGPDGFDSPKLKEVVGADKLNDIYFTTHFSKIEENEKVTNFLKAYKEKYGKDPDTFAALGYDLAYFVKDAIEKGGKSDSETITKAIAEYKDFTGVTGTFSMDDNHTPIKSIKFVGLKNGEQASAVDVEVK